MHDDNLLEDFCSRVAVERPNEWEGLNIDVKKASVLLPYPVTMEIVLQLVSSPAAALQSDNNKNPFVNK